MAPEGAFLARVLEQKVLGVSVLGDAFAPAKGDEQFSKICQAAMQAFQGNPYPVGKIMRLKNVGLWNPRYGDRSTELVLIGIHLDKEKVRAALETCLLTQEEYQKGPKSWKKLPDPWCDGDAPKLFWDLPNNPNASGGGDHHDDKKHG